MKVLYDLQFWLVYLSFLWEDRPNLIWLCILEGWDYHQTNLEHPYAQLNIFIGLKIITYLKSSMFDKVDVRLPDVSVVVQCVQESISEQHKMIQCLL